MQWFYTNAGKQAGPVSDINFERLVREGIIQPTTLVWHEGMADWQPYSSVAPAVLSATTTAVPNQVPCSECGRLVPVEDTLPMGDATICASCKPTYLQKLREGLTTAPPSFHYAGFWIRVPAAIIDGVILFAITTSIDVMSGSTFLQSIGVEDSDWGTRDWVLLAVDLLIDTTYSV